MPLQILRKIETVITSIYSAIFHEFQSYDLYFSARLFSSSSRVTKVNCNERNYSIAGPKDLFLRLFFSLRLEG